jgi:hypothetical protein
MSHLVVVAPLREGTRDEARRLIAQGPPYELEGTDLAGHYVYLTEHEVVFVFEGPGSRLTVERIVGDPGVWRAAGPWQQVLAGRPRLAEEAFAWSRPPAAS